MANWYLTIKDYVDTHNWAIMQRTPKLSDNLITLSDVDPTTIPQSVDNDIKPIKYQQLEWTLYKTINLIPSKQIKITIPANQWQIISTEKSTQFEIENDHYINKTETVVG